MFIRLATGTEDPPWFAEKVLASHRLLQKRNDWTPMAPGSPGSLVSVLAANAVVVISSTGKSIKRKSIDRSICQSSILRCVRASDLSRAFSRYSYLRHSLWKRNSKITVFVLLQQTDHISLNFFARIRSLLWTWFMNWYIIYRLLHSIFWALGITESWCSSKLILEICICLKLVTEWVRGDPTLKLVLEQP